jgi:uncharacterized protein (TIGR02466 family)
LYSLEVKPKNQKEMSAPKLIDVTPFGPTIIKVHYDGFNWDELKSICDEMISKSPQNAKLEIDGGNSSVFNLQNQPHKNPAFKKFYEWLTPIVNHILLEEWKLLKEFEYYYGNSWVNVHPNGGVTTEHSHGSTVMVAAAYLQLPEKSGYIQFKDPLEYVKSFHSRKPEYVGDYHTIPAKTGDVFLFPGWLKHRTEYNKSNLDRWVLTTNIVSDIKHKEIK